MYDSHVDGIDCQSPHSEMGLGLYSRGLKIKIQKLLESAGIMLGLYITDSHAQGGGGGRLLTSSLLDLVRMLCKWHLKFVSQRQVAGINCFLIF